MKISEVTSVAFRVETKTDVHQIIRSDADKARYVKKHGDVEVQRDYADLGLFRVPAFKAQIAAYTESKANDCLRYGSN